MKTVRRPPYPKWNPGYFPCSSLTSLPLSSRRPSVSFGGFGLSRRINAPGLARPADHTKVAVMIGPDIRNKYPVRGRRGVAETLALACAFLAGALIAGCGQGEQVEVPAARPAVAQPAGSPIPRLTPTPYTPDPLRSAAIEILVGARLATAIAGPATSTPTPSPSATASPPSKPSPSPTPTPTSSVAPTAPATPTYTATPTPSASPAALEFNAPPASATAAPPALPSPTSTPTGHGGTIFRTYAYTPTPAPTPSPIAIPAHGGTIAYAYRNTGFGTDRLRPPKHLLRHRSPTPTAHGGAIAYAHRHADTIAYAHRHADTFRPARRADSVHIL